MRIWMRLVAPAAVVVACLAPGLDTSAGAVAPDHPATVRVVVRPVTATGHARSGFVVRREPKGQVDCSFADPSPGAVSRNIEFCSPSAEYAIACWKPARLHRALCMRDPSKKRLVRIPRAGRFATTGMAPRSQRAPLLLVLTDGTRCSIRDGGAWGTLKAHPQWSGTYACTRHGDVWAPPRAKHEGVDESAASWTVRTAAASGSGRVVTRHVARAYYVGTWRR